VRGREHTRLSAAPWKILAEWPFDRRRIPAGAQATGFEAVIITALTKKAGPAGRTREACLKTDLAVLQVLQVERPTGECTKVIRIFSAHIATLDKQTDRERQPGTELVPELRF